MVAARSFHALVLSLGCIAALGAGCGNGTPCPMVCAGDTPVCDAATKTCVACLSDTSCPVGRICVANACVDGCNAGKTDCGPDRICEVAKTRCVRCLPTDDQCPAGQVCLPKGDAYECVPGCKSKADCKGQNQDCCAHACVDLTSSDANCGACGKACDGGKSCCAAACVDKTADVKNCGACGMACAVANGTPQCAMSACGVMACNKGFADCDQAAMNGCEITTDTDVKNCGACGSVCAAPDHGTAGCAAGACTVAACDQGFADCDKAVPNGCETSLLTDAMNCGACGMACPMPMNGIAACAAGTCGIGACDPGFADCDKGAMNGCEVNTVADVANCGACGNACGAVPNGAPACVKSACVVGLCNMGFADCDARAANGCEVDVRKDLGNCGACGKACPAPPNGAPACVASACTLGACNTGFGDCNKLGADGCEVNLTSNPANCGACGNACTTANGVAGCVNSACTVASCNAGFADCNKVAGDGCEVNTTTDLANCGACGKACGAAANGTAACVASACTVATCNAGFADCDKNFANGCEVNTTTNANNCGACGKACAALPNAAAACVASACTLGACNTGFGDCNRMAADGCEVNLASTPANCGACGNACAAPNGVPGCANSACTVASCNAGFGDCNLVVGDGCEVNTTNNVNHCGRCGGACGAAANGTAGCVASTCTVTACAGGFGDCDKVFGNGCETNLTNSPANCGACGSVCNVANGVAGCANAACTVASCNAGFGNCNGLAGDGCELNLLTDAKNCGACGTVCQSGICTNGACTPRTIANFTGQLGPDYSASGWTQCLGILDKANLDDLPNANWGAPCIGANYNQLRLVCGANAASVRYIDVKRNVLATKLNAYPETNLITAASGFTLTTNDIYASNNDPNNNVSWWVNGTGCSETSTSITINNVCTWDVANCFGQNLAGDRYFYVYVHP